MESKAYRFWSFALILLVPCILVAYSSYDAFEGKHPFWGFLFLMTAMPLGIGTIGVFWNFLRKRKNVQIGRD